ncbi:unnamed protein product [Closterium sp. Naga37s-1]|nr:unnamed protein product [Closterium sp. Naga37s-1]
MWSWHESGEEEAEAHVVAAVAADRPATSGKSIWRLAQHLAPRAGSAGPSGELGGKSPVRGPRDFESLAALLARRLAAEILQLDYKLESQAQQIVLLKKRLESHEGGIAVISYEELASAVANTAMVLEKEVKAVALERAALRDQRNQEELTLGRIDARLGKLEGVVVDSMEGVQKKLTDEVLRKIDNMSTAVSATAVRAITTSGVTNALHTLITIVSGSPPPCTDTEEPHATETAKPGDTENGKRAAGARVDNQRGAKRPRGPQAAAAVRNLSVQDILKQKWGAAPRGAGQPAPPGSCSRSIPAGESAPKPPAPAQANATVTVTTGKGKGKVEEEEPAITGKRTVKLEVQHAAAAADAKHTAIAPALAAAVTGRHGPSASNSAGPSGAAVEPKTEKRGRGAKKTPPPPVFTIDDDGADDELENLVTIVVGLADNGGDKGKVSEPHLAGKKCWLGHGNLEDLQYLTAVAITPFDKKVDPGLHLSSQQLQKWAADLSAAAQLYTGIFITMHLRNLTSSKDRWARMFKTFREITTPASNTTNEIALAAVVGKEAATEEPDIGDVAPNEYAGAVACAIAMVWEVTRGSNITAAADSGHLAAKSAGCLGERNRTYPPVVGYVLNAVRRHSQRENATEEDPKQVAAAVVSSVVNALGARFNDVRHVEMAAREVVDVLIT